MSWKWMLVVMFLHNQLHMSSQPLLIDHSDQRIVQVTREEILHPLPGVPLADEDKVKQLMDRIDKQVTKPPVNASLNAAGAIIAERSD